MQLIIVAITGRLVFMTICNYMLLVPYTDKKDSLLHYCLTKLKLSEECKVKGELVFDKCTV
jgi:hypothetical protein